MKFFTLTWLLIFQILTSQSSLVIRLYTQSLKTTATVINEATNLSQIPGYCTSPSCQNYVIIHGFNSNGEVKWALNMKSKLLDVDTTSNVFIVDRRDGAGTGLNYNQAVLNLEQQVLIAYSILSPLRDYINFQNRLINIYCIGHSLGSHFCGLLSKVFNARLDMKFEKITAMDPAGPCFEGTSDTARLSVNDAEYVEAIHTSNLLGYIPPIGHSDFYPNGGIAQPGCFTNIDNLINQITPKSGAKSDIKLCQREINISDLNEDIDVSKSPTSEGSARIDFANIFLICSHSRAIDLFTESITRDPNACNFRQYQCSSYGNFLRGRCNNCTSNVMGFNSVKPLSGSITYYGRTNSQSFFCNTGPPSLSKIDNYYCINSSPRILTATGALPNIIALVLLSFTYIY